MEPARRHAAGGRHLRRRSSRSIGRDRGLHADFGSGLWDGGPIGIPITVVGGTQKKSRVTFDYADESDKGPYPIPANVAIEGGRSADGDRHAIIVDRSSCKLYELYAAVPAGRRLARRLGRDLEPASRTGCGPSGWTSADAAGLPILPGLARYDEVKRGRIDHALRFTVSRTRKAFVWPARHYASELHRRVAAADGPARAAEGVASTRARSRSRRAIVLEALKRYGMIVADNGSDWYVSGAPDPRWSNDQLHTLGRVTEARTFEVVDAGTLQLKR